MIETNITKRWENDIPHDQRSIDLFKKLSDIGYKLVMISSDGRAAVTETTVSICYIN